MLKLMRESFRHLKWILLAVVAAFVFGFVFLDMGLSGALGNNQQQDLPFAARVNGQTITLNEYARSLRNYEEMYRSQFGNQMTPEMIQQMGLPRQVLESLIDQSLLTQEAERLHLTPSAEEVRRKLLASPTFIRDGQFVGMELYKRYVTGPLGYPSVADFERDLARNIALQKMESALTNSVVVSPKAAEAEYKRMNENAKVRYVLLPASSQAAAAKVSDAEIETYYRNNQSKYTHGEQRSIRYLLADIGKLRSSSMPTDANLRRLYDQNKEKYKAEESAKVLHILIRVDPQATPQVDAAARAKAEGIVKQLRAGADFAALAQENSDDPSSSSSGGDMGFVERGVTVEPFEKAIFSIPLNAISDPIRTADFGYHIVKVTERRPAGYRPFEEVKPELAARGANELALEQARDEINRIALAIKGKKPSDPDQFSALANDRVTSNSSGWFAKSEAIPGLGNNQPLAEWVFAAKVGDIGNQIGTQRGPIIPYVAEVRPAGVSPLSEVKDRVAADLQQQKAREAARIALQQMLAGAASIDDVAKKANVPVQDLTVNRQGALPGLSGDTSALIEAAIGGKVGAIAGPLAVNEGAVAFQIVEQKRVTPAELAQNRGNYVDVLRQQQARSLRSVLVLKLRKASKIEVNEEILRPPTQQAGL
jgi:peptidyl-prolyl cis-trans isomerase D